MDRGAMGGAAPDAIALGRWMLCSDTLFRLSSAGARWLDRAIFQSQYCGNQIASCFGGLVFDEVGFAKAKHTRLPFGVAL